MYVHEYYCMCIKTLCMYMNCELRRGKECFRNSEKKKPVYLIMETNPALVGLAIRTPLSKQLWVDAQTSRSSVAAEFLAVLSLSKR